MHFLYPAFLFALLTLAIPVIVHLFNFRRYQKVYFSNVEFLKELQEQQAHRRNLRERLILASRLLALFFLVLAFARPYFPNRETIAPGRQQVVSIFVDNSYSMQALNSEGSLLDEAKRRATEIASAYNINDRFQLLTQDFEGRHQRLLSRDEFKDAVNAVKISSQSRSLQQIVNRQQSLLGTQAAAVSSAYIISDFQTNMAVQPVKTDTTVSYHLMRLAAGKLPNVAVDSVSLVNAVHRPGEQEKLLVKLHNYSDRVAERIPLRLTINGAEKALGAYTLGAGSVQVDTLTFSGSQAGWQKAELQLQDNPVTFDNQFYFAFNVQQQMPVLLINGATPDVFLKAVYASDPFFSIKQVSDGNVDYSSLGSYPLVVVSNIKSFSTGLAQQMSAYVRKGGSLAVFPAVDADLNNYRLFLQSLNAGWLQTLTTGPVKVAKLNLQSGVFKNIFDSYPENPDLPQVSKYFQLQNAPNARAEYLMRLADGRDFWNRYSSGPGNVYVSAVPLNNDFSNLQRHALFVPVMIRIALLSGHDMPLFYTLGKDEYASMPPAPLAEKDVLTLTKGTESIIPDVRQQEGGTLLYFSDQVKNAGLYALKRRDSTLAMMAFNDSRAESDMKYFDAGKLKQLFPLAKQIVEPGPSAVISSINDGNLGLQLWKLCIILTLIFLAAEIALIRFFKADKSPKTSNA